MILGNNGNPFNYKFQDEDGVNNDVVQRKGMRWGQNKEIARQESLKREVIISQTIGGSAHNGYRINSAQWKEENDQSWLNKAAAGAKSTEKGSLQEWMERQSTELHYMDAKGW